MAKSLRKPRKRKTKSSNFGTKIVLIQGCWDIIHWGHIMTFERAKTLGDYLIVALNTNKLVRQYKKLEPIYPYWQKKKHLQSLRQVDKVISAPDFSPMKLLKKYKVDVYVLTREWKSTKTKEMEYMRKKGGKVYFMPRFKGGIPTSEAKRKLLQQAQKGETR